MSELLRALAVLLAAVFVAVAHSQPQPVPLQGGTPVTFRSGSPANASDLVIDALLFKSETPSNGAVVIVSENGGWKDYREGQYARALSSAGYTVLAVDSYGPRGLSGARDNAQLNVFLEVRDALAARRFLISMGYQESRTAIMGTGRGGAIALIAADRTFLREESARFALAMAISPACILRPTSPMPASNLLIAIGDRDDVVGLKSCKELANDYADAGGRVKFKVYQNATNAFDGSPEYTHMGRNPFVETFADCMVTVGPDERMTYNGKTFLESDYPTAFAEMRKSCVKRGASSWTNLTQKAAVTFDLIEFLDENFRR